MKVKTIREKSKVPIWKDSWISTGHVNKDYSGDLRILSLNRRDRNKGNPL